MKRKADIQKVQEMAAQEGALPTNDGRLNTVRIMLRDLIHSVIGYSESKTLEYDPDTQTFGIEVSCRTGIGIYFGTFTTQLTIDPRKDLLKQMQDLVDTVEQIKTSCFAAEQATEKLKAVQASLKPLT